MKKISIILISLFMFLLSGCNHYYRYDFNELIDSVDEIYIVEVHRTEYYGEISIDYLKEIENEFEDFLKDLSDLEFVYSIFLSPQNNSGMAIMLVYNNEKYDYAIIGVRGIEKFKNNKQTYFYNAMCDEEDFNNILNKYYKDQNRV